MKYPPKIFLHLLLISSTEVSLLIMSIIKELSSMVKGNISDDDTLNKLIKKILIVYSGKKREFIVAFDVTYQDLVGEDKCE